MTLQFNIVVIFFFSGEIFCVGAGRRDDITILHSELIKKHKSSQNITQQCNDLILLAWIIRQIGILSTKNVRHNYPETDHSSNVLTPANDDGEGVNPCLMMLVLGLVTR